MVDTFAKDREILFSINTDGSLASYSWSMGDNSSLIEGNSSVLYSYNTPGTYLVTVYANNLLGSYEKSFEISVDEPFWQFDAEGLGWVGSHLIGLRVLPRGWKQLDVSH